MHLTMFMNNSLPLMILLIVTIESTMYMCHQMDLHIRIIQTIAMHLTIIIMNNNNNLPLTILLTIEIFTVSSTASYGQTSPYQEDTVSTISGDPYREDTASTINDGETSPYHDKAQRPRKLSIS